MRSDSLIKKNTSLNMAYDSSLNCWSNTSYYVNDVCNSGYSFYVNGLGGPYTKYEDGCWNIDKKTEENSLVYFKKGSKIHGTPLVIKRPDYFSKNTFWTEYITSMFGCTSRSTDVYFVENDTLINSKNYRKMLDMMSSGSDTMYYYLGAIREEDGKVFGKFDMYNYQYGDDFEVQMYDFNLRVGDTVRTNLSEHDTWLAMLKPVISTIDTITLLNGTKRKRFTLSNGDTWIEGIGSLTGFLNPFFPMMTCGNSYQLMCFVQGNEELYHNDAVYFNGACGQLSAVDNVLESDSKISLSPNPVSDWLTVKFETNQQDLFIELYDIQGKLIIKKTLNLFSNSINLSHVNSGLYMYRILEVNKLLKTGKIIKL